MSLCLLLVKFGQVEVVSATIMEHIPSLKKRKELVVLVVCLSLFLMGLSCVSYVSFSLYQPTPVLSSILLERFLYDREAKNEPSFWSLTGSANT